MPPQLDGVPDASTATVNLKSLLHHALDDGAVYSALVPWILDCRQQAPSLSTHVQQKHVLQQWQLQLPGAHPQDIRQHTIALVDQYCSHACSLKNHVCHAAVNLQEEQADQAAAGSGLASPQQQQQQGQYSPNSCNLSQPAVRLAKLHGHLLAHGLLPDMAGQLHRLVLLLTAGPLPEGNSSGSSSRHAVANHKPVSPSDSSGKHHTGTPNCSTKKHKKKQQHGGDSTSMAAYGFKAQTATTPAGQRPPARDVPNAAASSAAPAAVMPCRRGSSPEQLLGCRGCAARYAAKALQCCSKLLCCLPRDLQEAFAASPHLQQYSPGLAAVLAKAAAAAASSNSSTPGGFSSQLGIASNASAERAVVTPQQHQHQQQALVTPVVTSTGLARCGAPSGSVRTAGGSAPGRLAAMSRMSAGVGQVSGLGMLMTGSSSTAAAAAQHWRPGIATAGKQSAATVCNREKSRDLFFSILRKCSTRLEALRQQQARAAGLQAPEQQAAATAVFTIEMQELLGEVGLAAKQLLLQLAPGNLTYLAELFTACVLQAASSGEPIMEPQLALIAEREPGRFHKLQQRLADKVGSVSAVQDQHQAAQQAHHTSAGAAGNSCSTRHAVHLPQKALQNEMLAFAAVQQSPAFNGAGRVGQHVMSRPRGLPKTDSPAGAQTRNRSTSGKSDKGSGSAVTSMPASVPRCIQPQQAPGSSAIGGSAGSNWLAAAAGNSTPLPFAAGRTQAASTGQETAPTAAAATAQAAQHCGMTGAITLTALAEQSPVNQLAWSGQRVLAQAVSPLPDILRKPTSQVSFDTTEPGSDRKSHQLHKPLAPCTPLSAPAVTYSAVIPPATAGAAATTATTCPVLTPLGGPAVALHKDAAAPGMQHRADSIMLQLLSEMPAGQHVLLLVLHAADSSSLNRSLLSVMLARAEKLLTSSPASLACVGGLGQQAASVSALSSYCSYLSFVAGLVFGPATSDLGARADSLHAGQQMLLLQQQPIVDIAAVLQTLYVCSTDTAAVAAAADSNSSSWCLALAIPFVCQYLRFADFLASAGRSSSVVSALQHLQRLHELPCMTPTHELYGSLAACVSACLSSCVLLQYARHSSSQEGAKNVEQVAAGTVEWLNKAVSGGSGLVDSTYWFVCCPGLQQVHSLLVSTAAAAARAQKQQSRGKASPADRCAAANGSAARPDHTAQETANDTLLMQQQQQQQQQHATSQEPAAAAAARSGHASSSSPAGSAGPSQRYTQPVMLAPRTPPVLDVPPACVAAALAGVGDPLKQQLQQAFIGQYSTDDNPVKMRDVLSLVNSILCANSLALALSQGVPPVLQQHLQEMEAQAQQQLGPAAADTGAAPLQGQEVTRAVHAICMQHSAPAVYAALKSAMLQASEDADKAAAAACVALLPSNVPAAATASAAALVAASCKASCAQRLLQEVPALVQATLADRADELVRNIIRQWAVHSRMTAPATKAANGSSAINQAWPKPNRRLQVQRQHSVKPAAVAGPHQEEWAAASSITALHGITSNIRDATAQQHMAVVGQALKDAAGNATECSGSHTPATARRIAPVPVPAAGAAARECQSAIRHRNVAPSPSAGQPAPDDDSGDASSYRTSSSWQLPEARQSVNSGSLANPASTMHVQLQNDAAKGPVFADGGIATSSAPASKSLKQMAKAPAAATRSDSSASPQDEILQQLLAACGSISSCAAGVSGSSSVDGLQTLQNGIASAAAEGRLADAVDTYITAALKLAPWSSKPKEQQACSAEGQLPAYNGYSAACGNVEQACNTAAWSAVIAAAACAAEVLVTGAALGCFLLRQLEHQLLAELTGSTNRAMGTVELSDDPQQVWLQQQQRQLQQHLCQLLAGAVLWVHLVSSSHRSDVFVQATSSRMSGGEQLQESPVVDLAHFVALPAQVMKIARTNGPVWLLQQLRVWFQEATLGCTHVGGTASSC